MLMYQRLGECVFEEILQHGRSLLDGALRAMTARYCTKRTITPYWGAKVFKVSVELVHGCWGIDLLCASELNGRAASGNSPLEFYGSAVNLS
jgi:hypothetical protein